jgi:hypothetical protein
VSRKGSQIARSARRLALVEMDAGSPPDQLDKGQQLFGRNFGLGTWYALTGGPGIKQHAAIFVPYEWDTRCENT